MAHLVTGYAGYEHIKSADDRAYNAAFFGSGQYVMESGNQFEGSIIDNNTVRILDGDLLMYGGHVRIEPNTYEDLTIDTGTAGVNRVDLICMTYEKNESDGTEKAFLQVIKGTPSESTASLPAYTDGNILEGAVLNQMPLYKVSIQGVALTSIEPMFEVIPTYKALAERYAAEFQTACETHLGALNILDTLEEVDANTKGNQLAGALALKEMHAKHAEEISELNNAFVTPDYSVISDEYKYLNVNSEIEIPEDGYIQGYTRHDVNHVMFIRINNVRVFYSVLLGDSAVGNTSPLFPVKKGDIILFHNNGASLYETYVRFYPLRR